MGNWLRSYWFSMCQLIGSLNTESHKTSLSFTVREISTVTRAAIHLHRPQSFLLGRVTDCYHVYEWSICHAKGFRSVETQKKLLSLSLGTRASHRNLFTYLRWKSISEKSFSSPLLPLIRLRLLFSWLYRFLFHENNLSHPPTDFDFLSLDSPRTLSHLKLSFFFFFA